MRRAQLAGEKIFSDESFFFEVSIQYLYHHDGLAKKDALESTIFSNCMLSVALCGYGLMLMITLKVEVCKAKITGSML